MPAFAESRHWDHGKSLGILCRSDADLRRIIVPRRSGERAVEGRPSVEGDTMASGATQKLSLSALTAMVVGSMVGAGIFNLPGRFGAATGPFGAIIAWAIAGTGMYMLARVFQFLAEKRPDIDSGVFAYAKAGFGNYMGFLSAFGYWIGSA